MKRLSIVMIALLNIIVLRAQGEFETATQAVQNMKVGWNLGNTLDAHRKGLSDVALSEILRSQPVTQPELMEMMRMAGFNAIRVPVTWYPHMNSSGTIDEAWLNRVQEVVDYVIDQGMYCIINVHHDTGKTENTSTSNKGWLTADPENYQQNKTKFEGIWRQIATRFKDYNHLLIFEGYNEMLDKYGSWNFATQNADGGYNAEEAAAVYQAINDYAQSFVDVVRSTGGNNACRNLVINTYAAADGRGTTFIDRNPLDNVAKPEDSNHIIFGVHTYPSIYKTLDGVTQNRSTAEIHEIVDNMIGKLNTAIVNKYHSPIIFGEWGTSLVDAAQTDYDLRRECMFEFVDYMVKQAKQSGMATFYWMGLSDRINRSYPAFNQPDLAEAILKAYYGEAYEPELLTTDDYDVEYYDVTFRQQWGELMLAQADNLKTDYKAIEIIFEETPNFTGNNLAIRMYKNPNAENPTSGTDYSDALNLSTNSIRNKNNVVEQSFDKMSMTPIRQIVFKWKGSGSLSIKLKQVNLIRKDGSKEEITPTSKSNTTMGVKAIPRFGKGLIHEWKYGTLYYSDKNLVVPANVTATTYRIDNDELQDIKTYASGDVIPAGTGVAIHSPQSGVYKFPFTTQEGEPATGNMLLGTDTEAMTTGGGKYYKVSTNERNAPGSVGFYYGEADGVAFLNGAHEAYLMIPEGQPFLPYYLFDKNYTGEVPEKVIITPDAKVFNTSFNATITGDKFTSKIVYTLNDGSETVVEGNSATVRISDKTNVTLKAWAIGDNDDLVGEEATATYTYVTGKRYEKITSLDQLVAGKRYVLVRPDKSVALGAHRNSTSKVRIATNKFTLIEDNAAVIVPSSSDVVVITLGGDAANGWTLFTHDNQKYVVAVNEAFNYASNASDPNSLMDISIDSEGRTRILSKATDDLYLRANAAASSFAFWTGSAECSATLYKEVDWTLGQVQESGVEGNDYTVSDDLQVVFARGNLVWARDLRAEDCVNSTTLPTGGQIDFMRDVVGQMPGAWQQSNWVLLDFSNAPDQKPGVGDIIVGGTLDATLADLDNLTLEVNDDTEVQVNGNEDYAPNVYCAANFYETNTQVASNGKTYWFMRPRAMEVATITGSVWNGDGFYMPKKDVIDGQHYNSVGLKGAFPINLAYDAAANPQVGEAYEFLAIIMRKPTGGSPMPRRLGVQDGATPGNSEFVVYPLTLSADEVVTAINALSTGHVTVEVTYIDVMGRTSKRPFQGLNIVVKRYSDGTVCTTKVFY